MSAPAFATYEELALETGHIFARTVPYDRFPILVLLGEMNSDDQRGAVRVIHNPINIAPNEEMFEPCFFTLNEQTEAQQSPF